LEVRKTDCTSADVKGHVKRTFPCWKCENMAANTLPYLSEGNNIQRDVISLR